MGPEGLADSAPGSRAATGPVRPSQAHSGPVYTTIQRTSVLYIASKHVHHTRLGVFLSPTGGSGSGSWVGPHSIISRCQSDHPREDTGSPFCPQVQSLVSCLVPCTAFRQAFLRRPLPRCRASSLRGSPEKLGRDRSCGSGDATSDSHLHVPVCSGPSPFRTVHGLFSPLQGIPFETFTGIQDACECQSGKNGKDPEVDNTTLGRFIPDLGRIDSSRSTSLNLPAIVLRPFFAFKASWRIRQSLHNHHQTKRAVRAAAKERYSFRSDTFIVPNKPSRFSNHHGNAVLRRGNHQFRPSLRHIEWTPNYSRVYLAAPEQSSSSRHAFTSTRPRMEVPEDEETHTST